MIEIINKPLLLHLVGYLCYWQMGFNSVFKGLNSRCYFSLLKSLEHIIFLEEQMASLKSSKFYRKLNVFACKQFFFP